MADNPPELMAAVAATLRTAGCVYAEDEARLLIEGAVSRDELAVMVGRRAAGEPLEHVLGWAEFCGLRLAVGPGVFVPRRRTEFLVRQAVLAAGRAAGPAGRGSAGRPPLIVVDLCCGSGAVGVALAAALEPLELGPVELHAADIDPAAVACARRNLAAIGGRVYLGDLYQPLPDDLRGRVAILAANVPYVPAGQVALLPGEAREHEPRAAVDGGADGLDVLRRVAARASSWLAPGGHLLTETSERQAAAAVQAVTLAGLTAQLASCDELNATVVTGTRPAGTGPAGTGPAGTGPAGTGPAGTGPAGTGPAGTGPAGTGPAGTGPAGAGRAQPAARPDTSRG